ncbi:hypothetical protein ACFX1R_016399 [Malus domestica]
MVISSFGIACRPHFCLRTPPFHCIGKVQLNLVAAMEALDEPGGLFKDNKSSNSANGRKNVKAPVWKKLNSKELGITTSMIDKPTRKVLNGLKRKGYEVYLVGGCVRDLILNLVDIVSCFQLEVSADDIFR